MTLEDWLNRLERLHFKDIDMGLDRITPVAERLSVLSTPATVITVAGTNGKGSTLAVMESVLLQAGLKVGLYTSPHLVDFNERIRIDSSNCENAAIVQAFDQVEKARQGVSLTYFEFTTLAALLLFQHKKLDVWLLEVGLGGRLDAVNICSPDVAVVTSIDLDHQQWLGETRAQIGLEKIGIGRREKPLVMGEPNIPAQVDEALKRQGSKVYRVQEQYHFSRKNHLLSIDLLSSTGDQLHYDLSSSYLLDINVATALQALALMPLAFTQEIVQNALGNLSLKGRQQWLDTEPPMVLDVGHNPHAARGLRATLSDYIQQPDYNGAKVLCVVGMLADKDIAATLMELLPVVDEWLPVAVDTPRGEDPEHLRRWLQETGAVVKAVFSSASQCCNWLFDEVATKSSHPKYIIVVFGSFYTVSDVIQYCPQANDKKATS